MSHRPTQIPDPVNNQPTTINIETSITVTHEDLLWVLRQPPLHTEVFTYTKLSPTSQPGTPSQLVTRFVVLERLNLDGIVFRAVPLHELPDS